MSCTSWSSVGGGNERRITESVTKELNDKSVWFKMWKYGSVRPCALFPFDRTTLSNFCATCNFKLQKTGKLTERAEVFNWCVSSQDVSSNYLVNIRMRPKCSVPAKVVGNGEGTVRANY